MDKKAIKEILKSEGLLERFMETLVDEINRNRRDRFLILYSVFSSFFSTFQVSLFFS